MQYDVLTDNLAQRTLVEEYRGKLLQVVERNICGVRPAERELEAAIGVVGKIASVYTIGLPCVPRDGKPESMNAP